MKQYLKRYEMILTVQGAVFVGSGKEIRKKEYLFDNRKNCVRIINVEQLYEQVCKEGLADSYEKMLLNPRGDLNYWLDTNHLKVADSSQKYILECGDNLGRINRSKMQIMEFVKDSYGQPYVPGTTIKGMLRTILLGSELLQMEEQKLNDLKYNVKTQMTRIEKNRKRYLKGTAEAVEKRVFRTLLYNEKNPGDAVNDILSGVIVSDSEPLSIQDLVLCQKVDVDREGKEHKLNLLRESLRAGTQIKCSLTIDTTRCQYDGKDILNAVNRMADNSYNVFIKQFPATDRPLHGSIWLGGGSGFVSKTIVYALFGYREGVKICKNIFENTGVPRNHRHYEDITNGVSPHMLKCTRYDSQRLQWGLCTLELRET